MPERPDLRKIAADIREALDSYPREALADILTYVFQAYVVEGMPTVAATQPERLQELEGMSFADVIATLQTRLDLPELALFEVSAGRVSVRVGGQLVPLVAGRGGEAAVPAPAAQSTPAAQSSPAASAGAAPRPGVSVQEVPSSQLRPPPAAPAPSGEAPPPRRGLSINVPSTGGARPATQAGNAPAPAAPAPATQAGPAPKVPPTQPAGSQSSTSSEPTDEGGSKRFSLLDID